MLKMSRALSKKILHLKSLRLFEFGDTDILMLHSLLKGMLLSKALTCFEFFLYKQKWLFYQGDKYFWLYCSMGVFKIKMLT